MPSEKALQRKTEQSELGSNYSLLRFHTVYYTSPFHPEARDYCPDELRLSLKKCSGYLALSFVMAGKSS